MQNDVILFRRKMQKDNYYDVVLSLLYKKVCKHSIAIVRNCRPTTLETIRTTRESTQSKDNRDEWQRWPSYIVKIPSRAANKV